MTSTGGSGVRLEPPAPRRANILRPRLLRRLLDRFATPVTVVVAPAGFGKTTLLAQAVTENRLSPLGTDYWLTCSADDVAGSSLAEGLCLAMGVSPPGTLDGAIGQIVETTWHHSPAEVALVIDDVHEITADSPGAHALARLAATLPRNGHLVLSGRQAPPIPLSRLEVQGDVVRLGESDLLFTDEELAEFYAHRHVPAEQMASSGGWPALAELAASAGPQVETAYLWEEVLDGIRPDRRRDLALLAHVGAVDDGLATAALGHETDVADLTAGLPLVATTATGGRQIHSLWRPHLAKVVDAGSIAEARRRAGLALAGAGDVSAAVRLLAAAGAWDDVTDVVADILGPAHPPVAGDVMASWLGQLPDHLADGPLGRLLGAVAVVQTDPRTATAQLRLAADAFREEGNPEGELACMSQLGQLAWWSEDPELLLGLAVRVFEMEALGHETAIPLACLGRALIADMAADCEQVLAELDRIPAGALHSTSRGLVDWLRSTSLCHLGRPEEALEAADAACAHAGVYLSPAIQGARLQALWYLGRIEHVLDEFPIIVERAAATGLRDSTSLVAGAACLAYAAAGRAKEAARFLELARHSAAARDLPVVDVNLVICEAVTALVSGDESGAARTLDEYVSRGGPVGAGLAAFAQQRSLVLWYLLAPSTRPVWEAASPGPCFAPARDLARALVAIRSEGRIPASTPPLPDPDLAQALVPLPWLTELALAHIAAGRQDGWTVLEAVWPQAQADVRRHADDGGAALTRPARAALARLPVPPSARLDLRLLGPVELSRDEVLVDAPEWRRQRVRSLLADLAVHRLASRERLAGDLWPDLDAEAQSRNLRVTLTHLLRVLEPERGDRDASFLIRPHGFGLKLYGGEWFDTDLWRFDDLWQRATTADQEGSPSAALDAMRQAVSLWRDDPSELAGNEWALPHVEERRLRLVNMAARAGELLLARDDPQAARQMGEAALRCDPWCERAHHVVVAAHTAAGHHRAARDALHRYHEVLTELGITPVDTARKMEPLTRGMRIGLAG